MNRIISILASFLLLICACNAGAQKKYQAKAPATQTFGSKAFEPSGKTVIRWLGNAGFFINSHGTCIMVDPLLKGFDMPLLIDMPILPENVPHLDAVLITHCDNDHYSIPTCLGMSSVCDQYHSTRYVASLMEKEKLPSFGHDIGEAFEVGSIRVRLTAADHAWQNLDPQRTREYKREDYCGFWMETPDGTIWAPGDSRLLPEHLQMPTPDAIFFDFSDDSWHIGLEGAVKVANTYPNTPLLLTHWGSVDAPDMKAFNGDPQQLSKRIINPERIHVVAPGEPFTLESLTSLKTLSNPERAKSITSQQSDSINHKVRISKIVVDSTRLNEYNAYLKEEIEESMRLEAGVLTLYATSEKNHPNRITILEIYANEEAYQSHIKTPHFLKYKQETLDMVQDLELIDANPLIPGLKIK